MIDIMNTGEKHIACVLLVDTSGSMSCENAINELNQGLREFGEALKMDSKAYGCADVCVISFNNTVQEEVPFSPAANFTAPTLSAYGCTALNEAIITGLDAIEMRKQEYKDIGVDYWRPWIFLLTDGLPTDDEYFESARTRIRDALDRKKINFFPMGIGPNADIAYLKQYTKDGSGMVLKANLNNFKEAFVWLSSSMSVISNSDSSMTSTTLEPLPKSITIDL